eukprot:2226060-Prorocentrum_lima.AAC.1
MLEDSERLDEARTAFLKMRAEILTPECAHLHMAGLDRMLRQTTAALAQGALLHSTRELLVAHWEFLSLQGQEP